MYSEQDKQNKYSLKQLSKKLLSTELDWSEWINDIESSASASFPIIWDSYVTGKNDILDEYTDLPVFETTVKVARMNLGDHTAGSIYERSLPIQPDQVTGIYTIPYSQYDTNWYYQTNRKFEFFGKSGEMMYSELHRTVESNKRQYRRERRVFYLSLEYSIHDTLLKQMKISTSVYNKIKNDLDIV